MHDDLVQFLRELGAEETQHSGTTLLDHLVATAEIVERWGGSEDAQKAALFHSIYGTEFFGRAPLTLKDRMTVVCLIGLRSERLAMLFCMMLRRSLYDAIERGEPYYLEHRDPMEATLFVTEEELRELLLIVWANAVEQWPRARPGPLISCRGLHRAAAFLPAKAVQEVLALAAELNKRTS